MFVNPSHKKRAFTFSTYAVLCALSFSPSVLAQTTDDISPGVMAPQDEVPLPPLSTAPTMPDLSDPDPVAASSPEPQPVVAPEPTPEPETTALPTESAPPVAEQAPPPVVEEPVAPVETELDYTQISPTASTEAYKKALKRNHDKHSIPSWSFNFTGAPFAFRKTDIRTGSTAGGIQKKPKLYGVLLSGERMLIKSLGILSVGLEGGLYTSFGNDPAFEGLSFGFMSAGAYAMYQFHYVDRQWFVPFIKAQEEGIRHAYRLSGQRISGINVLTRFEAGLLFFLNFLEPSSAGDMYSVYGVKRTYFSASYTLATDSTRKDFDMSEATYRAGVRFEF